MWLKFVFKIKRHDATYTVLWYTFSTKQYNMNIYPKLRLADFSVKGQY